MEYTIDDIKIYSRIHWYPTSTNLFKALWNLIKILIALEALYFTRHMPIFVLIIGVVAILTAYFSSEIK